MDLLIRVRLHIYRWKGVHALVSAEYINIINVSLREDMY